MTNDGIEDVLRHLVESVETLLTHEARRVQTETPAGDYDDDYSATAHAGSLLGTAKELRRSFERATGAESF